MLVEHLVHRALIARSFDNRVTTSVLFGEFVKTIVWQGNLVLQGALVVGDGNLQIPFVGVDAKIHVTPPLGLILRELEKHPCMLCGTVFFVLLRC
jgi:hypothetical protein